MKEDMMFEPGATIKNWRKIVAKDSAWIDQETEHFLDLLRHGSDFHHDLMQVYDACYNMMQWLKDDYDISLKDSYIRMSCDPAVRVRTYQMVRAITLQHVAGTEYPRHRLTPAF